MFPVATPVLQNCTFTAASFTPPQIIEEGLSTVEQVLAKDLLCMHDVEVLNHTYLALDRLEKQQGKIPERNSSTALKMIADKVDAITKGSFGSRGYISLYYLQRFAEEKLQLPKRFEGFGKSMTINQEEVAVAICNCGTEEQFDSDVKMLIGRFNLPVVKQILYEKKEKFRQMAEQKRKIEAIKEKWRQYGSSCVCPLTLGLITDPVLDEHGHCYERRALVAMLKTQPVCPLNDEPLTENQLIPNDDLKKQIESYRAQGFSMTLRERKDVPKPAVNKPYNKMTRHFITETQELEHEQKFREAEELYCDMLRYTSRSEDYAHIPAFFEKKGEKERAAAAYVVLADLQRAEGKLEEEIATLQKSLTLASNCIIKERLAAIFCQRGQNAVAAELYLELAKQALYNKNKIQAERFCGEVLKRIPGSGEAWKLKAVIQSDQAAEMLMKGAGEVSVPIKERIGLCKMVMLKEPTQLQANMMFLQLDAVKAKNKMSRLKSKVSEMTNSLPKNLSVIEARAVQATAAFKLPPWVFGASEWNKYFGDVGAEPPLPADIIERLPELSVDNVLVLIPKTVNGQPLTLKALGELVQKPLNGGNPTQYFHFYLGKYIDRPNPQTHWALLTRTVFQDSLYNNYKDGHAILASYSQKTKIVYEIPTVLDATVCLFMEYMRSGIWLYSFTNCTYCQEEFASASWLSSAWQLAVGGVRNTLSVVGHNGALPRYYVMYQTAGVGGLRKL